MGVADLGDGGVDSLGAEGAGLVEEVTDEILVFVEELLENGFVENLGTVELGGEEPDEEAEADPVEVGDEVEDKSEEGLDDVKESEDHPVGEPHLIVVLFT